MKIVSIAILSICIVSNIFSNESNFSTDSIINKLILVRKHNIDQYLRGSDSYKRRIEELKKSVRLNFSQDLFDYSTDDPEKRFFKSTSISATGNNLYMSATLSRKPYTGDLVSGDFEIGYTIKSELKKKIKSIEEIIDVVDQRSNIFINQLLINDLRSIILQKINLMAYSEELKIRKKEFEITHYYLSKLKSLIDLGVATKNSLRSLEVSISDNQIKVKSLNIQKRLIYLSLQRDYNISKDEIDNFKISPILTSINYKDNFTRYATQIDSINFIIQDMQNKESTIRPHSIDISYNTSAVPGSIDLGAIGINFNLTLKGKWKKEEQWRHFEYQNFEDKNVFDGINEIGSISKDLTSANKIDIEDIYQRIKLGQFTVAYELSQTIGKIVNREINLISLRKTLALENLNRLYVFDQINLDPAKGVIK